MQVKKFEAPTLQEALETIKRELGPEAIILQTKQNRRGFGLMSKGSVEVTAALSDRATKNKKNLDAKLPEAYTKKVQALPASAQADVYEKYLEKRLEKDRVQISKNASAGSDEKKRVAVRYADIVDEESNGTENKLSPQSASSQVTANIPNIRAPRYLEKSLETFQNQHQNALEEIEREVKELKALVARLQQDQKRPEYLDSDSPFEDTVALQEGYHLLIQNGIQRRFAIEIIREASQNLSVEFKGDADRVLDSIADVLLKKIRIRPLLQEGGVIALTGVSGVGKTALIAKLSTHLTRNKNLRVGIIRIQLYSDEAADPLVVLTKALHIPYRRVQNSEELTLAIQDLAQSHHILIDTPGIGPKDGAMMGRMREIFENADFGNRKFETHLVLPSTTRDLELQEQAKAFSELKPSSIIFSKLDETLSFGSIYSLSRRTDLPISVFSNGKKVTQDWENASAERLTASILNLI